MTVTPMISVVMPCGSVEPELDDQLAALAKQTLTAPWELVISLNTPDHDARRALDSAVERFGTAGGTQDISVVDSSGVRSASHARNIGASAARSQLLAFCDSDDIADPEWLAAIVRGLADHSAVGGYLEEKLLAVPGQENWRPPATPGDNPSFMGFPYLVSANMGIRAGAFETAGGFDEDLIRGEDIAFSWLLLRNNITLGYCPEATMHYRHRKGLRPMLRQHYLYGRGMSQLLARHGLPDGSAANGAMLRANGQRVERMNAVHVGRKGAIGFGRLVGLLQETVLPKLTKPRRAVMARRRHSE